MLRQTSSVVTSSGKPFMYTCVLTFNSNQESGGWLGSYKIIGYKEQINLRHRNKSMEQPRAIR